MGVAGQDRLRPVEPGFGRDRAVAYRTSDGGAGRRADVSFVRSKLDRARHGVTEPVLDAAATLARSMGLRFALR